MTDTELTALVSSRICHDLISPIGAIGNGVELISVLGGAGTPEMNLIGESAASATAKLRFFRIAFGAAGDDSQISASEARDITSAMFQSRFRAVWEIDRDLPRLVVKALFLALLCAEKSVPLGGNAMVMGSNPFSLVISASKVVGDPDLWGWLEGKGTAEIVPGLVQFPLLGQLARDRGFDVVPSFSESTVELRLAGIAVESPVAAVG
jgi:histidine phosphotransferase ChpT